MTTPSHLQDLWMEQEGGDIETGADTPSTAVDSAMKRFLRRVKAVIKYAQGHCQDKEVKEALDPLETYVASLTTDMSTAFDDVVLDVAMERPDSEKVLPVVKKLEELMHRQRRASKLPRTPKTVMDLYDEMKNSKPAA